MHTPSLAGYVACLERGDLGVVGGLLLESANKLAAAGADFLICRDAGGRLRPAPPMLWQPFRSLAARSAPACLAPGVHS